MYLNHFPNKPLSSHVCIRSLLKTLGKGLIACYNQILLFPQCFLPLCRTFHYSHQIYNCCPQTFSIWESLRFVICEWVKHQTAHFVQSGKKC